MIIHIFYREDKSTDYNHFHNNNCYKKIDAPDYNIIENKINNFETEDVFGGFG